MALQPVPWIDPVISQAKKNNQKLTNLACRANESCPKTNPLRNMFAATLTLRRV
jgi:hypothetical protein